MALGQEGLGKHLELPKGPHNSHDVKLVHELARGLLKQEVALHIRCLLVFGHAADAETLEQVAEHIREGVLEARAIDEGEEEALDVDLVNLLLLFEVLLNRVLSGLDLCKAVLECGLVLRQYLIGAVRVTHAGEVFLACLLDVLVVAGLEDLVNDATHELLRGPVVD